MTLTFSSAISGCCQENKDMIESVSWGDITGSGMEDIFVKDETKVRETDKYRSWRNGEEGRINRVGLCELVLFFFNLKRVNAQKKVK